jgi:hypothetical protein
MLFCVTKNIIHSLCRQIGELISNWAHQSLGKLIVAEMIKTPPLSWNRKVHYGDRKSRLVDLIFSHLNTVHSITVCFFKICFNILSSTYRVTKWYFSYTFSKQKIILISLVFFMSHV